MKLFFINLVWMENLLHGILDDREVLVATQREDDLDLGAKRDEGETVASVLATELLDDGRYEALGCFEVLGAYAVAAVEQEEDVLVRDAGWKGDITFKGIPGRKQTFATKEHWNVT
ncbi:hypothetical protein DPMN_184247 [Dreissena polymorpha]|uniref:Uncharacterized protein n=1 Tax=Dreissena polymorpha TaxID=45954 RepID=A0A9D4DKH9_DREPO|nr:hypothetical protein DPMN_184247 [Dreissena polymorpha]